MRGALNKANAMNAIQSAREDNAVDANDIIIEENKDGKAGYD